uniref:Uncharacterized protein n=1 Tax=Arundo donax TaxID=35708 RepID=A0A0A9C660_ARUDO
MMSEISFCSSYSKVSAASISRTEADSLLCSAAKNSTKNTATETGMRFSLPRALRFRSYKGAGNRKQARQDSRERRGLFQ